MTNPIRDSFVERFGEEQAQCLELAADQHRFDSGVDPDVGGNVFQWCLTVVIGFECITRGVFRGPHGITIDPEEFAAWCRYHADLRNFTGGGDVLAESCGSLERYMAPALT